MSATVATILYLLSFLRSSVFQKVLRNFLISVVCANQWWVFAFPIPAMSRDHGDAGDTLLHPRHLELRLQIVGNLLAVESTILDEYLTGFGA